MAQTNLIGEQVLYEVNRQKGTVVGFYSTRICAFFLVLLESGHIRGWEANSCMLVSQLERINNE